MTREEAEQYLYYAMTIGEQLLCCGAEVGRVEDTIRRICLAYGATRADVFSITSSIVTTIYGEDFGICTQTRRVPGMSNDLGRLDDLTIGLCGDLKFGRTVHSLIKALSRYSGIKVILIAPQELRLPDYMLAEMSENSKLEFREVETMEEVMPELDVLYMTRVQKERFLDEEEFDRVKNSFVLNPEKLGTAKKDMIILHPLPRVNEITRAVDNDSRAAYFRQVENGKFVRMALILTLLRWADRNKPFERTPVFNGEYVVNEMECSNRRCISATEDVDQLFYRTADGTCRCAYCEAKAR